MKKRIAVILVGMTAASLLFGACGRNAATEAANESEQTEKEGTGEIDAEADEEEKEKEQETQQAVKVGVLLPSDEADERWAETGASLKQDLENSGYEAIICYADEKETSQSEQIEELMRQEAAALIVAPEDPYGLAETLGQVKEKSIPVFSYERLIMDTDAVSYYAAFDMRRAGQMIGENIVKIKNLEKARENKESYSIEFLMGSPDEMEALFLYNGIMEVLQSYFDDGTLVCPSQKVSFDDTAVLRWSINTAKARLQAILDEFYPEGENPDILCTASDEFALGALEIFGAQDMTSDNVNWPCITGVGCNAEAVKKVAAGEIAFSLFMDPRTLADECVKMVDTYLSGEKPEVTNYEQYDNGKKIIGTYTCDPEIIDKDNYQMLLDNGFYTEEEITPELTPTPLPTDTPVSEDTVKPKGTDLPQEEDTTQEAEKEKPSVNV